MHLPRFAISSLLAGRYTFDFESSCESLASQAAELPNTTVLHTQLVPAGTNITFPPEESHPSCLDRSVIVSADICRISLNVTTSASSKIRMEAWLPSNWTGRFLSTGNGGLGGCIQYSDMAYTSSLGFATVGANNGHEGMSGAAFLNAPEVLADFAYRSIHTNVVVGKEITELFYGSPHTKSYYLGCSTGGRQGFKSVQDFPEDFDGVVAGAPAIDQIRLFSWVTHFYNITGATDSPTFIPVPTWLTTIHQNILDQCDDIDGVKDLVVEDPNLCNYDPSELLCADDSTSGCLSEAQVETVRKVFSPFTDPEGNFIFSRAVPGSESNGVNFYSGSPFPLDWFPYVVFSDPSFDTATLTFEDYERAIAQNPFDIATLKGDLSAFQYRNGKLLTYHGTIDGTIPPGNSERYYEHVSSTMNLSPSSLDSFYRFFRISGMNHCAGGEGAWQIGQGVGTSSGTEVSLDPEANVLMAMVRWVEEGVAPDTILGTKFVNDSVTAGVAFSRRHCRYPLRNTYDGTGDSTKPESWSCQ